MRHFAVFIFVCGFSIFAPAQKETSNWFFGDSAAIKFNNCSGINNINGSSMTANEGTAVMSDAAGNLLFYTNGFDVYNRNSIRMPNGDSLKGGPTGNSSQGALIVPDPGSSTRYYVFTTDELENQLLNGFNYSVVDMNLDGGLGDITTKNINLIPTQKCGQKVTAYKRNDGNYWVIAHGWGDNKFYVYLLNSLGVTLSNTYNIGNVHTGSGSSSNFGLFNSLGPMKLSPDGTKLGVLCSYTGTFLNGFIELFDFNISTGAITNAMSISLTQPIGFEFSPNNKYIYVTGSNLQKSGEVYQYDISSNNITSIKNSKQILKAKTFVLGMQLGPDCNIYITTGSESNYLNLITNPNLLLPNSGYIENAVSLKNHSSKSALPNFVRSYFKSLNCSNDPFFNVQSCTQYSSPSKKHIWTSSGTYIDTLIDIHGCDSTLVINLSIPPIDTNITIGDSILTSKTNNAQYQWLDCNNGYSLIPGETSKTYIPTMSGNYAVQINLDGCIDTSVCASIITTAINSEAIKHSITINPNPVHEYTVISNLPEQATLIVKNSIGQEIFQEKINQSNYQLNTNRWLQGIYYIEISTPKSKNILRLIKY